MSISCTALRSAILTSIFFPLGSCLANCTKFCMERKILPCLQNASQHVPVYLQQFPSYSNHSCKKIVIFTYPGFHFLFALGTPLWQSHKTLHKWKDKVLAIPLAACTHLSSTVSQLFEPQLQKIAVFTYRSPHFRFPWPAIITQYVAWMEKQNNPLAACTYIFLIVSELHDA